MYECSPNAIVVVLHVTWSSSNFEAGFVVVGFFVHQAAKKEKKMMPQERCEGTREREREGK